MKYILVHAGDRDYYKVAEFLYKNKKLCFLVTDDLFFRKKINKTLPPKYINISYIALVFRILELIFPKKKFNFYKDQFLSKKAAQLSKKNNCPVFSYSYYGYYSLKDSKCHPKVLFQLHPHPISVRKIFNSEIKLNSFAINSLKNENEIKLNVSELSKLCEETKFADFYFVASSFTKETLIENGACSDRIAVVPYGVDLSLFKKKEQWQLNKVSLDLIFIGSFNQRKGLSYLLQAVSELQLEGLEISLNLCGRGIIDDNMIESFNIKNLSIYKDISTSDMVKVMQNSDVFVFPSLCEGFGFVILQAMSVGLPVITTENTSGKDILNDGFDGFVGPIQNVEFVKEKIKLFYNNRSLIKVMGENAIVKVGTYTWEKFGENLISNLRRFEKIDLGK